jgi:hypothetical protein
MKKPLLWLVLGMLLLTPHAARAQGWTGAWRLDLDVSGDDPTLPYLLNITKDDESLVVERRWIDSTRTSETMRYYLDGRVTSHAESGQWIESTATVQDASILVKGAIKGWDGRVAETTDVYLVLRNRLELERTITENGKETSSVLVFVRLPGNVPLHGGTGDQR